MCTRININYCITFQRCGSWKCQGVHRRGLGVLETSGGRWLKSMCSAGQWGFANTKCRTEVELKPRTEVLTPSQASKRFIKVEERHNAEQSGGLSTILAMLKLVKFRFHQCNGSLKKITPYNKGSSLLKLIFEFELMNF